jgi:SulP family sulfate permease
LYELKQREDGRYEECPAPAQLPSHKATVIGLHGNEFYATVATLTQLLPSTKRAHEAVLILEVRALPSISTTLVSWLQKYAAQLDAAGNKLMLAEVDAQVVDTLQRSGVGEAIGEGNIFPAEPVVGASIDDALAAANAWILGHET